MTAVYVGGKVRATSAAAAVLAKRTPVTADVAVTGGVGSWRGTPIAVVAYKGDVTLLVKDSSWTVVGGWWPSLKTAAAVPVATTRILAVGSDARPNQTVEKCRADALHIIGVDNKGVGGMVGVPRDAYVPLSTGGSDKVNAALVYGGVNGIVKTIERATGVKIDGYLLTGFKGFRAIVDGVGGIPYVSKVMLKSDGGTLLVRVGKNILDGSTGLGLARERHSLPNGDFGRSANQGAILQAGMAVAQGQGPGRPAQVPHRDRRQRQDRPHRDHRPDPGGVRLPHLPAGAQPGRPGWRGHQGRSLGRAPQQQRADAVRRHEGRSARCLTPRLSGCPSPCARRGPVTSGRSARSSGRTPTPGCWCPRTQ